MNTNYKWKLGDSVTLGKRLRKLRIQRGYSQIEASKKLNIADSTLSNYERDQRHPDPKMLIKMIKLYNTNADYLLGLTNDHKPYKTSEKEEEFFQAINDPDLFTWWEELPKNKEEELKKLREMWNIMQRKEN